MSAPPLYIADAQSIALSHAPSALPARSSSPLDALGMRLAADVTAQRPHPPFPAAIKDGFAIAAGAGAGARDVIGASRAGASAEQPALAPHQSTYVTTGAPMPPGMDAVVQIESARQLPEGTAAIPESPKITFDKPLASGAEVRAVGSDIPLGALVLRAHDTIGPAEVGLLTTVGCSQVDVFRRPRVGVLSTGDELVDSLRTPPIAAPSSGAIFDCNRPMLLGLAAAAGAEPVDLGIAADTLSDLTERLDAAVQDVDVLVTSGGVSMGDRDLIKGLLASRGTVHYGKVVMKPGKPLTFATVPRNAGGNRPPLLVFGLPGNPVSAFACFHLVVAPVLRRLAGDKHPLPRRVMATLAGPFKMDAERPEYHRSILSVGSDGGLLAHSTGGQISSRLLSCKAADALVELPARAGSLPAGTTVTALLIGDLQRGAGIGIDALTAAMVPPDDATPAPQMPAAPLSVQVPQSRGGSSMGCRIGLLVQATAGDLESALLSALAQRLAPGSWLAEARTYKEDASLQAALAAMCDDAQCSVVLCLGASSGVAAAVKASTSRLVPAFGSLMRSACLQSGGAAACLLGDWCAGVREAALIVALPDVAAQAIACVDALLPAMGHAVAQAGGRPPPRRRVG